MASIPTKLLEVIDIILDQLNDEELYKLAEVAMYEKIVRFVDENGELFIQEGVAHRVLLRQHPVCHVPK